MQPLAFDAETRLIRPAQLAPQPACFTWQRPGFEPRIEHANGIEARLRGWLQDPECLLVGHNIAFDMAVICEWYPQLRPLVFAAYDANRVTDTMIRAQLLDIAAGTYRGRHIGGGVYVRPKYALEDVASRTAGIKLQKDGWRLSYGEFVDVPLARWTEHAVNVQRFAAGRLSELRAQHAADPKNKTRAKEILGLEEMIASSPEQCKTYPLEDARATLAVFLAQEKHAAWLENQFDQARASFALYLSSAWGLRTDELGVEILRAEVTAELEEITEDLGQLGIVRANGSRNTKLAKQHMLEVCARDGIDLKRTEGHIDTTKAQGARGCKKLDGTPLPDGSDECEEHVSLDEDACTATDDGVLIMYAQLSTLTKVLGNDVEALSRGIMWPVHTRYGLAETGRTTSSKPNIQNWVRSRKCKVCDGEGEIKIAA